MARIRTVKPEFSSDYRLAKELSREMRLFYVLLWNEADDEARFQAHPRRVLGACFPYDNDLTPEIIESWLALLESTDRLIRYTADGEPYGYLTKFPKHQRINRPTKSRLPPPPSFNGNGSVSPHGKLSEDSSPHARAPELEKELGTRSREEEEDARPGASSAVLKLHASDPLEESINQIILAANRGLIDNPLIGDTCQPIPISHGSRQFVADWLADGIPEDVAARIVYQRAKSWVKSDRRKQISTMAYFDGAVRDEGDKHLARVSSPPSEQKPSTTHDNSDLGRWKRANPEKYEQFEKEVLEDLQRYPWWEETRDKQKEIRDRLTERIWPKPAVAER